MKALPSIAFNDFSGTAEDVTARHFRGRTVLTVRPFPSKVVSSSQKTNRKAMSKISRAFKKLTALNRLSLGLLLESVLRANPFWTPPLV